VDHLRPKCQIEDIKTKTGCQYTYIYVGYFYYSEDLNWAACGQRVGHSWFRRSKQVINLNKKQTRGNISVF